MPGAVLSPSFVFIQLSQVYVGGPISQGRRLSLPEVKQFVQSSPANKDRAASSYNVQVNALPLRLTQQAVSLLLCVSLVPCTGTDPKGVLRNR